MEKMQGRTLEKKEALAASGVGSLYFIRGIINENVYVQILWEHLKASVEKCGIQ